MHDSIWAKIEYPYEYIFIYYNIHVYECLNNSHLKYITYSNKYVLLYLIYLNQIFVYASI